MSLRRASPEQIAAWIHRQGRRVTPVELRVRYGIGDETLRRRRADLAQLGVVYVGSGRQSHYVSSRPVFDPALDAGDDAIGSGTHAPDAAIRPSRRRA